MANSIVTKTGDKGQTSLTNGQRVSKAGLRVNAYGDVDELNSALGVAIAFSCSAELTQELLNIQKTLFALGYDLATPCSPASGDQASNGKIIQAQISSLEAAITAHSANLPPLSRFIIPGGCQAASLLQLARAICRRAERSALALALAEPVNQLTLVYLNRLSDYLFIVARRTNLEQNCPEETL